MKFLLSALDLLGQVPAAFWGVVVGSFFSILGVWLSNAASERRLRAQFGHEMREKAREREIALKKEIYLAAVAELAQGLRTIGTLSNVYESDAVLLRPISATDGYAVAKVAVVASANTVRTFARLHDGIKAAFLTLYPRRLQLLADKNAIDRVDGSIARAEKEQEHILEQMKQKNIAGDTNETAWRVLNGCFDFEGKRVNDLVDERTTRYQNLTRAQFDFNRQCIRATTEIASRFVPVLVALRSELDMPLDGAVLTEVLQDAEEVKAAFEGAMKKFGAMAGLAQEPEIKASPESGLEPALETQ